MNFLEFRSRFFSLSCFSIHQVYAWEPGFSRNNFVRWTKQGLLVRLRQGWFTFPEYLRMPGYGYVFANRIYSPSYVSLQSALAYYEMIPEGIMHYTSVTSLKTSRFSNVAGEFYYYRIKEDLIFGYEIKVLPDGTAIQLARPEKALLDFLYLHPEYRTTQTLADLRLDEEYMQHADWGWIKETVGRYRNRALENRIYLLEKLYVL